MKKVKEVAKSQKEDEEEEKEENILEQIKKEYKSILLNDKDLIREHNKLATGIYGLDYCLEGGLPRGRVIHFHAEEGVIKTTLSLFIIAAVQKQGKICAFIDMEGGFDTDWATKIGVDVSSLLIFRPECAEKAFEVVFRLCDVEEIGVVVIDSMANMLPQAEKDKNMDEHAIGAAAKLNALAFRKLTLPIMRSGMVLICLNQERDNVGVMYGKKMSPPGGRALKHVASVEISFKNKGMIEGGTITTSIEEDTKDKIYVGKYIMFKIEKSRFSQPLKTGLIEFYFDGTISNAGSVALCGLISGVIEKTGNTYTFKDEKFVGKKKLIASLNENEELIEEIKAEIEKTKAA